MEIKDLILNYTFLVAYCHALPVIYEIINVIYIIASSVTYSFILLTLNLYFI